MRLVVPSPDVARWDADWTVPRAVLRRICRQARTRASTGFGACQTCSSETIQSSTRNGLVASELSPGTSGRASANDIPDSEPAVDLTVFLSHRRRYLSIHRAYGLLFRHQTLTTAQSSLTPGS